MEGIYQFYRIYDTYVMTLHGHIATSGRDVTLCKKVENRKRGNVDDIIL